MGGAGCTSDGTASNSESYDPSPGAGFSEVTKDHGALQDFLRKRKCHIEMGTVCDTSMEKKSCLSRIREFLEPRHTGLRILIYLGDGSKDNGSWCFIDGDITLR